MSDQDHPRDVDRPKLAQALASLKEGLRDTADPFFDGWKKPRAAAAVLDNVAAATRTTPAAMDHGTADPASTEAAAHVLDTEVAVGPFDLGETPTEARIPPHDEQHAPTLEMAKVLLAPPPAPVPVPVPAPAPAPLAPLRDTVRVRVVEFPLFPRWAMVTAIGLLLFAASVVALRAAYRPEQRAAILVPRVSAPATVTRDAVAGESMVQRGSAPLAVEHEAVPHAFAADTTPTQTRPTSRSEPTPHGPPPSSSNVGPASQGAPRARTARDVSSKSADSKPPAPGFFREPGF